MSFSYSVKEELSKLNNLANKDLVAAELKGYLITTNALDTGNKIKFSTENEYNINRFNKLLSNLKIDYNIKMQGNVYIITFKKQAESEKNEFSEEEQKAIVRGAFLGSGSINNPNNTYHLEILINKKKMYK